MSGVLRIYFIRKKEKEKDREREIERERLREREKERETVRENIFKLLISFSKCLPWG